MYCHCRFLDTLQAATIFLNSMARPIHLAPTDFATQLRYQLIKLANAGRAQGMTFGFQPT